MLDRYAVSGTRQHVIAQLAQMCARMRPELLLFDAYDYSIAFLEQAAAVAVDARVVRPPGAFAP